jgi:hypothetical protein
VFTSDTTAWPRLPYELFRKTFGKLAKFDGIWMMVVFILIDYFVYIIRVIRVQIPVLPITWICQLVRRLVNTGIFKAHGDLSSYTLPVTAGAGA